MKKMQLTTWLQNKMVLAALLMLLVAGTAVAGVVALREGEGQEQEETEPGYAFQTQEDPQSLDQQWNQLEHIQKEPLQGSTPELEQSEKSENEVPNSEGRPVQSDEIDTVSGGQENVQDDLAEVFEDEAEAETLVPGEDAVIYEPESQVEDVIAPAMPLDFQADSTMGWPVFGNVLLDYSMDTTIYFPTLKQYKCNPGILIQAEIGQPVTAAVRGQVTAIGTNEEWGNFIMMDLGGEYTLCYGQLENIPVSVGQIVEAEEVLGTVAKPTKYYVVEGPNIYVEMRYQQEPVDPLDYIR